MGFFISTVESIVVEKLDKETKLYTNSSGSNTNLKNIGNQFKRFGIDGHGP